MNGQVTADVEDAKQTYKSGRIGFQTCSDAEFRVRRIEIIDLAKGK